MSSKNYKKLNPIGKGVFGTIYEGLNTIDNQKVALKVINLEKLYEMGGDYILSTIQKEEQNMKKCECESTVKFYGHYEEGNNHIMVMELCDETLKQFLEKREKGLSSEEIFNIFSKLNNAFKKMYDNQIIHRDIKPENILIKYNDANKTIFVPKLTDFGFSKELRKYSTSTIVGTFQMIAPEIINKKPYNSKADLWSLGLTIYYCYFKEYPYNGKNKKLIVEALKEGIKLKRAQGLFLADLIDKLLVEDPNKRLSWKEYFEHPFFKYTSLKRFNTGAITNNFKIFYANYTTFFENSKKIRKVLIKSYKKNNSWNNIYNNEYDLFTEKFKNNKNVLELINKFEYKDENNDWYINFVFNLNDNCTPLYYYSRHKKFEENEIKNIANILFNIYSKIDNSHYFISIYSFVIVNYTEIKIYDFCLNKYYLSEKDLSIYYSPNEEEYSSSQDISKTNVMNYGITLLLLFNNYDKELILNNNKFVFKLKYQYSSDLCSFLNCCMCNDIQKRPNFLELKSNEYVKNNFILEEDNFLFDNKKVETLQNFILIKYMSICEYYRSIKLTTIKDYYLENEYFLIYIIYEFIILKKILTDDEFFTSKENDISIFEITSETHYKSFNINSKIPLIKNMKLIDVSFKETIKEFFEENQITIDEIKTKLLKIHKRSQNQNYTINDDNIDENFIKYFIQNFESFKYNDYLNSFINNDIIDNDTGLKRTFYKYLSQFIFSIQKEIFEIQNGQEKSYLSKAEYIHDLNDIFKNKENIFISVNTHIFKKYIENNNININNKKTIESITKFLYNNYYKSN